MGPAPSGPSNETPDGERAAVDEPTPSPSPRQLSKLHLAIAAILVIAIPVVGLGIAGRIPGPFESEGIGVGDGGPSRSLPCRRGDNATLDGDGAFERAFPPDGQNAPQEGEKKADDEPPQRDR
jgi:hypothetical protein